MGVGELDRGVDVPEAVLDAFAAAGERLAHSASLDDALGEIATATAHAVGADLVVVRVLDPDGCLRARALTASSQALAAQLEGSRYPLPPQTGGDGVADALADAVDRTASRLGVEPGLVVPVLVGARAVGSVELYRTREPLGGREQRVARLAAAQAALAVRAFGMPTSATNGASASPSTLDLTGDALAAGLEQGRTGDQIARLAAEATGAAASTLWDAEGLDPLGSYGEDAEDGAREAAIRALADPRSVVVEGTLATIALGRPPFAALQLRFPPDRPPAESGLEQLASFGVRAAHALRLSDRAGRLAGDLERTQALLAVLGQAIARLSLSHTLETAVDRVAALLGVERLAVYLRDEEGRLTVAEARGLTGPHVEVADQLLELALGPFRARGTLEIEDAALDIRLVEVAEARAAAGIEAAVAVPLLVTDELIGLFVVYPPRGRALAADETALLSALAVQLGVAVQNARLHERTTRLAAEREEALAAESQSARELRSLYEISRSFVQELTLDATIDAVVRAVVELLGVDAAVLRVPDDRGDELLPIRVHVAHERLEGPVASILARPQRLAKLPGRRLFRAGRPLVLDAASAANLGASYELLVPFLERGATCVVVPVRTPTELLATLTLLSLDPARPITGRALELADSIVRQAAIAIDRARLYEQQKSFSDTMQRSLLPRTQPDLPGLDVGAVYASSARVEVGGDVYDFLTLPDGRLAVALGDVTGHGIDATADMAMTKFVFRSLTPEHPEPGDFLAFANEVAVGELAAEKFVTLVYMTVDPTTGELVCASAGHPQPRLVRSDGPVEAIEAGGLALGIEPGQVYDEVNDRLAPGSLVVLYTDGVVEARGSDGELWGHDRLDACLAAHRELPAREVAEQTIASCREFAGGDLEDDCAIVVVKRT
jgi:serine phosphatase RsbU (regulator of sigma subunit)/PAS domain-containing protein